MAAQLNRQGFDEAYALAGGYEAWVDAGGTLEPRDPHPPQPGA